MADPPRYPESGENHDRGATSGVPRWVKVFAITVALLVLLVVAVMFVVGGDHGPGRHTLSGASADLVLSGSGFGSQGPPPVGHS